MVDIRRYRSGYSLGVGAVVRCGDKVLLVRPAAGARQEWAIPGGYVEPGETIDAAVQRELLEEAGVRAELCGLIGVRSRVSADENSAYFMFLLQAGSEQARADGLEVGAARYFSLPEIEALPNVNALSRLVIRRVFTELPRLLTFQPHPDFAPAEYALYL